MAFEEKATSDPFFTDVPWEVYYDDEGLFIGELYRPLPVTDWRKAK